MSIDKSQEWWVGSEPDDIKEYLETYSSEDDGYAVQVVKLGMCECASHKFHLKFEPENGIALRRCAKCSKEHFVADSEDLWEEASEEADIVTFECFECSSTTANISLGLNLYDDGEGVRWMYLGVRCSSCGILGCVYDTKVGGDVAVDLLAAF